MTPDQISKLPPELRKAAELCEKATPGPWRIGVSGPNRMPNIGTLRGLLIAQATIGVGHPGEDNAAFIAESRTALPLALTYCLQMQEERDRSRFKLFHYSKHEGTSHTTACSIWREDGQGRAEGFEGGRGPCNCGALENFERKRAETAEATIATLTRELKNIQAMAKKFAPSAIGFSYGDFRKIEEAVSAALSHTPEGGGR